MVFSDYSKVNRKSIVCSNLVPKMGFSDYSKVNRKKVIYFTLEYHVCKKSILLQIV